MPSTHNGHYVEYTAVQCPFNGYKTLKNISLGRHRNGMSKLLFQVTHQPDFWKAVLNPLTPNEC